MHGWIELQIICIACSFWRKHVIWWLSYILPIIYSFLYLRVRSLQFSNEKPDIGNVSNTVMCLQYCDVLAKCNLQYWPILSNTGKYWPNVICTDDAQTILWVSICRHNWTQSCRTQLNNTTQSCTTHNPIRLAQFNSLRHTNGQCATTEWSSVQAVRVSAVHCLVSSVFYLVSSV